MLTKAVPSSEAYLTSEFLSSSLYKYQTEGESCMLKTHQIQFNFLIGNSY